MIVACPSCKAQYRLDPSRLRGGRGRLRCARCSTIFAFGAGPAPPAPPVLQRTPAAETSGRPAAEAVTRGGSSRLVVALVAVAESGLRDRVASALARLGVRSVTADDGPASLETARRVRPRLIVLGAWLPGLIGLEVARAVRQDPALAGARILALGGPAARGRHGTDPARAAEADAHVEEDVGDALLEDRLRQILDLDGAPPAPVDREGVQRWARLAVADLLLYHAHAIDAGLRLGEPLAGIERQVDDARIACLNRFPTAGTAARQAVLAIVDSEVRRALGARRAALGMGGGDVRPAS